MRAVGKRFGAPARAMDRTLYTALHILEIVSHDGRVQPPTQPGLVARLLRLSCRWSCGLQRCVWGAVRVVGAHVDVRTLWGLHMRHACSLSPHSREK